MCAFYMLRVCVCCRAHVCVFVCVCVCECVFNEMCTFVGLCKALWTLTGWGVIDNISYYHNIYMTLFVMFYHSVCLSVWVALPI